MALNHYKRHKSALTANPINSAMLPFSALNNHYYATFILNNKCSALGPPWYFGSINQYYYCYYYYYYIMRIYSALLGWQHFWGSWTSFLQKKPRWLKLLDRFLGVKLHSETSLFVQYVDLWPAPLSISPWISRYKMCQGAFDTVDQHGVTSDLSLTSEFQLKLTDLSLEQLCVTCPCSIHHLVRDRLPDLYDAINVTLKVGQLKTGTSLVGKVEKYSAELQYYTECTVQSYIIILSLLSTGNN